MINRVVLVGRLTKDVDYRVTPQGTQVASFTLACNRPFSNASGEKEADFIPVVVFKKQAENCSNYLHKGSLAGVDGRIQVRNYEKDGKRVYVTEVIADSVQFLDPKTDAAPRPQKQKQPAGFPTDPYGGINIQDDDLPF